LRQSADEETKKSLETISKINSGTGKAEIQSNVRKLSLSRGSVGLEKVYDEGVSVIEHALPRGRRY